MQQFGKQKFGSIDVERIQPDVLAERCREKAANAHSSGRPLHQPRLYHMLQALARFKSNQGVGKDDISMDLIRQLPFFILFILWRLFVRLFQGELRSPCNWRHVPLEGFPKKNPPTSFLDYRWLAKLCADYRLYMRMLGDAAREHTTKLPNTPSCQVTCALFKLAYYADVWGYLCTSPRKTSHPPMIAFNRRTKFQRWNRTVCHLSIFQR